MVADPIFKSYTADGNILRIHFYNKYLVNGSTYVWRLEKIDTYKIFKPSETFQVFEDPQSIHN